MGLTKRQKKLVYESALNQASLGNLRMLRMIAEKYPEVLAEFDSFAEDFRKYSHEPWYKAVLKIRNI